MKPLIRQGVNGLDDKEFSMGAPRQYHPFVVEQASGLLPSRQSSDWSGACGSSGKPEACRDKRKPEAYATTLWYRLAKVLAPLDKALAVATLACHAASESSPGLLLTSASD
jgi:hypothetical protein